MNNTLFHYLTLSFLHPLGAGKVRELLEYFDNDIEALLDPHRLSQVPNLHPELLSLLRSGQAQRQAEKEWQFAEKNGVSICHPGDERYPQRLMACNDAPLILYQKGNTDLNTKRIVSVVGTRKMTAYGSRQTEKLVEELSAACPDLIVVSGLATGIDSCAHRASLQHGLKTVGVLAHGLDRIYPAGHYRLAEAMLHQGGLLTEFPHETTPFPSNFVQRNRIVAGLCDACIVIESAEKGGSLITARMARDYDREVFALPGKSIDTYSRGCNWLIKKQIAALIETAGDLLAEMNWDLGQKQMTVQGNLFPALEPPLAEILALMESGHDYSPQELLILRENSRQKAGDTTQKGSIGEILSLMIQLELTGAVISISGGHYRLA